MGTLSTVNVKITGDTGSLVSSLTVAEKRVTAFSSKISSIGTQEARGFSNLARGFTNAAGQSGVLNSEISILASSVGNVGLASAGAGIGLGVLVGGLAASINSAVGFETAITRVAKTANFSASETKAFGDSILEMSRRLPVATSSLTDIAVVAGQLGINGTQNIATFVEEVAKLSSTTGVGADVLATALGTLTQVSNLPIEAVHNISAAITQLGNTSNSTEQQILDFSTRLVGVTSALGVPIADLLGISSSFAAAGVDAERGATAIQRVFIALDEAAANGGDKLQLLADITGLTADAFKNLVKTDPGIAFAKFVEGLKGVDNVIPVLDALGIADSRLISATLSVANSNASVTKSIQDSRQAAIEGTATNTEFGRSADTTAAKFQILKNNINATAIEIGNTFNPAVAAALDGLNSLFEADVSGGLDNLKNNFNELGSIILDAATSQGAFNDHLNDMPGPGAVDALTFAFDHLGESILSAVKTLPGIGTLISGISSGIGLIQSATSNLTGSGQQFPEANGGADVTDLLGIQKGINLRNAQEAAKKAKRTVDTSAFDKAPSGGGGSAPHELTALEAAMDGVITRTEALTLGLSDQEVIMLESAVAANKVADAEFRNRIGLEALAQAYPGLTGEQVKFQLGLQAIAEHLAATGESIQQFIADTSAAALSGFKSAFDAIFSRPTKESAGLKLQIDQLKLARAKIQNDDSPAAKGLDADIKRVQALIDVRSAALEVKKDEAILADKTLLSDADAFAQAELTIQAIGIESVKTAQAIGNVFLETYAKLTGTEVQTVSTGAAPLSLADALKALAALPDHGQSLLPSLDSGGVALTSGAATIQKGERFYNGNSGPRGESGQPINITSYITVEGDATEKTVAMIKKAVREESETALRRASFRGSYVTSGAYTPS